MTPKSRNYDLAIVGGSFAGLTCAYSSAARGVKTIVLERKSQIGASPHTTGLLVKEVADDWEIPLSLTRKIRGVRIYSPSLKYIDLASPGYYFLATDTSGILRWFASKAESAGAEIITNTEYRRAWREVPLIRIDDAEISCRFLVGADGARSLVAKTFRLGENTQFLFGVETEYEGIRDVDEGYLHCFLDSRLAPGYIGWVVPGCSITQVGLACRSPFRPRLNQFVRKVSGLFDFTSARIVDRRGGVIPIGGPVHPFSANGILLVGDAAGLVSPLTAGGIHTALDAGRRAGQLIANHLLDGGPEPTKMLRKIYPRFFYKRLMRLAMDIVPPNGSIDMAFANPIFRHVAQTVFFHHRGLLSPAAWRDIAQATL